MAFLFGFLPLLFIPCLFVGQALDFLRYSFIALCVLGLGAMWYRQMFTSSTRTTISIIYAALCVVTISLLLNGSGTARQASTTNSNMPPDMQLTPTPAAMAAVMESTAPEETPSPVTAPGESEAELRLVTFMELWSANRCQDMIAYVQPSWATNKENPNAELFNVLANRTPEEYTIETISGTDADTSRTVTLSALINKNNGKDPVLYRFMVMMVKEGGEWYVDPNSLATNDVVTQDDATGAATTSVLMTPVPRMTETPVPDPSTKLYYNPDGGKQYHADPNCSSIKAQYLPLQGSFLYSELKSHQSLQPCLKCGAPTKALE